MGYFCVLAEEHVFNHLNALSLSCHDTGYFLLCSSKSSCIYI